MKKRKSLVNPVPSHNPTGMNPDAVPGIYGRSLEDMAKDSPAVQKANYWAVNRIKKRNKKGK